MQKIQGRETEIKKTRKGMEGRRYRGREREREDKKGDGSRRYRVRIRDREDKKGN